MSKDKKTTINVQGTTVAILSQRENDFISLTDIARHRDIERTDYIIQNWLRNRATIEYLGLWEQLNNPGFNSIEFEGFRFWSDCKSSTRTPSANCKASRPISERARWGSVWTRMHRMKSEFAMYLVATCAMNTRARGRFGINNGHPQPSGLSWAAALKVGAA